MANTKREPTVNDLRVKLCYICREEEHHDKPEDPPKAWTHPCSCTLIAHESCLLEWIKAAQADSARRKNALNCPQCGARYQLQSDNPPLLRFMSALDRGLSSIGVVVSVASAAGVVVAFASGLYVFCTAYGASAVRAFVGQEIYDNILSDDPSKWPLHAYLDLPLIPFALILSRTPFSASTLPVAVPIVLAWPSTKPLASSRSHFSSSAPRKMSWPPSPATCVFFLYPTFKLLYRGVRLALTRRVLGLPRRAAVPQNAAAQLRAGRRFVLNAEGVQLRVGIDAPEHPDDADENNNNGGAGLGAGAAAAGGDNEPDQTIRIAPGTIGRAIGGALALPYIASAMGSLLLRLSRYSRTLRRFLAVRAPLGSTALGTGIMIPPATYGLPTNFSELGLFSQVGAVGRLMAKTLWKGSPIWHEADPVWWRNSIGLGVFIIVKDAIKLVHIWLARREIESRKLINRSFAGIDPQELDLIDDVTSGRGR